MHTVLVDADQIRGREAIDVAKMVLASQFGGQKPTNVEVRLTSEAERLFLGPKDRRLFQEHVTRHLIH